MVANRRNLVFRVSIVINIAVILYVAVHLSGTGAPGAEWVPLTVDGSERGAEFRYFKEELRNETEIRDERPSEAYRPSGTAEVATSQKTQPTAASTNKTASSTVSLADLEKRVPAVLDLEPEAFNDSYDEADENYLSEGTLTRLRQLLGCHERDFEPQTMQRGDFWVLKNYVRADHGPVQCHETVSYTTHAGFEFLDNVQPLVERWQAPVSLAIHAPGTDYVATVNSIRYLRDCLGTDLVRQFVTFHLFFSTKHIPNQITDSKVFLNTPYNCTDKPPYTTNASTTYMHQKNLLYPVNVARNVARDSALTHFILPSDIELYPSPNLVPRFLNMIARNGKPLNSSTKPRVFPISIFEVDAKSKVPTTKVELQKMLKNKTAIPFHKHVCPHCHNIPQAQQWMTSNDSKQMEVFHVGKRRGPFVHWEPIFIGTHQDPYYDERLSWDGKKDKMTQGYILCVKDYDFMILNNAFLTHKPGIKHYTRNSKRDEIARKQNAYVKKYIMPELKKLYGVKGGCAI